MEWFHAQLLTGGEFDILPRYITATVVLRCRMAARSCAISK